MTALLLVYAAGALVGFWRTDGPLPTRLALAILWPVGLVAFVVTMTGLVALAAVTSPLVGATLVILVAAWWTLGSRQ